MSIADSASSPSSISMYSSVSKLFSTLISFCFEENLGFMSSVLVEVFFYLLVCSLLGFSFGISFVILFELGISWDCFLDRFFFNGCCLGMFCSR